MSDSLPPSRIAVVSDGKPGHRNQSLGLADALCRQRPGLAVAELAPLTRWQALSRLVWPWRSRVGYALAIGAGHGTHLTLLALGRVERCPTVVLMRPTLPGGLFTLRIEPRHDGGVETHRCWLSEGPLNRMQPAAQRTDEGLLLIGGPSPHFSWDPEAILEQVARICDGRRDWTLSSSRRTPAEFMDRLEARGLPGLQIHRAENVSAGWLAERLPRVQHCWVTPDSASMVYEALTAGCAVGLLEMPARDGSRVAGAMASLREQGMVTAFGNVEAGAEPAPPAQAFAEADRCARAIVERGWL